LYKKLNLGVVAFTGQVSRETRSLQRLNCG